MKERFIIAVLFSILLFTELRISSEGKEFSSLSAYCQWAPTKLNSRNKCVRRCDEFKGFIIPGSDQLVCFHDSKVASLISLLDEETESKQCGLKTVKKADRGRACNPKITCKNETDDQCSEKCSKYTAFITLRNRKAIAYCGETSVIEPITRPLDAAGNQIYNPREDRTIASTYNCSCGIGEDGKEVRQPLQKRQRHIQLNENPLEEMVASCPHISLKHNQADCARGCKNLNGIYSREDNKFICFHLHKNVTVLRATEEYCECRVGAHGFSGRLLIYGECPPERRIQLNNGDVSFDCPKKCANYKAYIYSPKDEDQFKVYCEFPSYIFGDLSYEIGKRVVADSKTGTKHRMFECACGVRLSQSEINSKINEFFIINDGFDEVRNNLQISNHSDVRSDEMQTSDSQLFAKLDAMRNQKIDSSNANSISIRDLIPDGENPTNNNNSDDSNIPIVGKKRRSRKMNDENDRGKKKSVQIERSDEIEPTAADLEIPSSTCQHTALLNNNTLIASSSSSKIPKFDLNCIPIDEDVFHNFFAGDPFQMSCHHTVQNTGSCQDVSHRGLIRSNASQNIGLNRNTIKNTGVGPSSPQNRELICNNTSQIMRVNHSEMQSNEDDALNPIYLRTTLQLF